MSEDKSNLCGNCQNESRTTGETPILSLKISLHRQSIGGILDRHCDQNPLPDYRCKIETDDANANPLGCGSTGHCKEQFYLTVSGDFMIIHL